MTPTNSFNSTQTWHKADGGTMAYAPDPRFLCAIMNGVLQCKASYGIYSPGGYPRAHYGYDVSTRGTDWRVFATGPGTVKWARVVAKGAAGWGNTWEWGYFVWIVGDDGYDHICAHMKENSLTVKEGQRVSAGQQLGTMGKTGNAAGDAQAEHVHYEVRKNGTAVDPTPWLGMLNLQGWVDFKQQEEQDMGKMYCFDITEAEKGKLEIYRSADNNATFSPARKLPAGKSIIMEEVTIKNMPSGLSAKGLYIQLEKTGERVYTASGLGIGEIVQNEVQTVLDRFYPSGGGVSQAAYDAMVADRDGQKAAKEAEQKKVSAGLAAANTTVKALEGGK